MKAILAIDEMPSACDECNCAIDLCHGTIPSQEWYNKRPSWCPLRPLPQKKWHEEGKENECEEWYRNGWNDCLDAITGGTE